MKTFTCKRYNSGCDWTGFARTEELLTDIVAVHLREDHGTLELSPDDVGKIKNLFQSPSAVDAAGSADRIFEEYNCDRDPQCTWRYIAQAEAIITGSPLAHSREVMSG